MLSKQFTQPALNAQTHTQATKFCMDCQAAINGLGRHCGSCTCCSGYSNTWIVLSNSDMVRVPAGADPDSFRKVQEARLRLEANPKPRKAYHRTNNGSRRNRRARLDFVGDIVGRTTARQMDELAAEQTFVSGPEWDDDIPFDGSNIPYEDERDVRFEYAVGGW